MTDIPRSSPSPEEHDDTGEEELDGFLDEVEQTVAGTPAPVEYLGAEALRKLVPKPRQVA